jgi:hypothetical protein
MGFMALYLFNISADAPDAHAPYVSENLAINDMESMAEIFLEEVCNLENAVPEQDDPDRDDDDLVKIQKIATALLPEGSSFRLAPDTNRYIAPPGGADNFTPGTAPDILSPPPQCGWFA